MFSSQPFVSRIPPLEVELDHLPQVSGTVDTVTFGTMRKVERELSYSTVGWGTTKERCHKKERGSSSRYFVEGKIWAVCCQSAFGNCIVESGHSVADPKIGHSSDCKLILANWPNSSTAPVVYLTSLRRVMCFSSDCEAPSWPPI